MDDAGLIDDMKKISLQNYIFSLRIFFYKSKNILHNNNNINNNLFYIKTELHWLYAWRFLGESP